LNIKIKLETGQTKRQQTTGGPPPAILSLEMFLSVDVQEQEVPVTRFIAFEGVLMKR
jgi:hypothetical protein